MPHEPAAVTADRLPLRRRLALAEQHRASTPGAVRAKLIALGAMPLRTFFRGCPNQFQIFARAFPGDQPLLDMTFQQACIRLAAGIRRKWASTYGLPPTLSDALAALAETCVEACRPRPKDGLDRPLRYVLWTSAMEWCQGVAQVTEDESCLIFAPAAQSQREQPLWRWLSVLLDDYGGYLAADLEPGRTVDEEVLAALWRMLVLPFAQMDKLGLRCAEHTEDPMARYRFRAGAAGR